MDEKDRYIVVVLVVVIVVIILLCWAWYVCKQVGDSKQVGEADTPRKKKTGKRVRFAPLPPRQ